MNRKVLMSAIVLFGTGCLISYTGDNMFFRSVFKLGTMVFIIMLAFQANNLTKKYKSLIIVGLFFSIFGDAFLLLKGDKWFLFGLFSFLTAHIIYIFAFMSRWRFSPIQLLPLIAVAVYSFSISRGLHNGMVANESTHLFIPVIIYIVVIAFMGGSAVITRNMYAISGSIFFIISDSILAWGKFVNPFFLSSYLVMFTYYIAQFLLTLSIEKHHETP